MLDQSFWCRSFTEKVSHSATHTNGVDVRLMASKGLSAHALAHVPQLSRGIASSRHKGSRIRSQRQAHNISSVTCKGGCLLTSLYVPESTAEHTCTDTLFTLTQMIFIKTILKRGKKPQKYLTRWCHQNL